MSVFFSYLVSCCVSVALSCLLRTATPSVQDAQGGGGNPRTPPARGSRLGGGVRRQLGWFLRAPLRSVLPSTLDAQSTGSFWHFSMHSRALVVVLGVLAIRIHDLKNRLGSTEDTDPACFCKRMWFCTGKQLPTCCFFSLGHSCFFCPRAQCVTQWACGPTTSCSQGVGLRRRGKALAFQVASSPHIVSWAGASALLSTLNGCAPGTQYPPTVVGLPRRHDVSMCSGCANIKGWGGVETFTAEGL